MKIRDIIVEIDTALDPAGTAVGRGVGKAGYGAGYAAGKLASKFGSGSSSDNTAAKKANIDNEPRSARLLRAIGRGIKSGVYKYGTSGSSLLGSYDLNDLGVTAGKAADGATVPAEDLDQLIKALPTLKVSWKVDMNAVKTALAKVQKGESLYGMDQVALKTLAKDLKKA